MLENVSIMSVISISSIIIVLINAIFVFKANITASSEKRWKDVYLWLEKSDHFKADIMRQFELNDIRIKAHDKYLKRRTEFEELVLLSLSGILKQNLKHDVNDSVTLELSKRLEEYTSRLSRYEYFNDI